MNVSMNQERLTINQHINTRFVMGGIFVILLLNYTLR